ncbi:rod shape-determining protein RodA [Roseinatronobacter bogoriensis]|uniref:Peptidoglycan glycosyltransferase MrdB n=1 Tax=Roseinatronobacter bogoriensis subsp. barguzinensis TaxID=441209 RepID=A0A2K8KAH1_9RHOB|nr:MULTISPECIES: rod shape-determining protein RodA [Rhodobaca]ATX66451.1 rod shape-determining protein RodA [Rhodobaca barguzinensis]MBB4207596.1 rod shape determining protein RodA [Rhodobaca bogoriensis DSM 18756]TDW40097.1 cell elongation-specific peptidoglycan biosynthesis regulator RodA [Rhodobaca barguzinensis]TDY70751.1 cell elongation-specific peptidoglycan biosynthesis regulator RodA [Rhodobaca bogoriensis DSM 18756]
MSYLEYNTKRMPAGLAKVLYLNWPLVALLIAVGCYGFVMLYSIAGGSLHPWAEPQMKRFAFGLGIMFVVAFVPLWFWRSIAGLGYVVAVLLLLGVEFFGSVGMGAKRWLEVGPLRLQPSELAKITTVMALAAYYDWLDLKKVSHPIWVVLAAVIALLPAFLVLRQPDLGTALLVALGGGVVIFAAGVHWGYFAALIGSGVALVTTVMTSRGTDWQLLKDYQFRRIDAFLDPSLDPLGAGYHINQSMIALGSGGWSGRGFMEGTQARLNFLPEKHTDFIFTTLAEEFGFVGASSLLLLYLMLIGVCLLTALRTTNRFAALMVMGIVGTFFLYFAVNMAMVMGLAPVVGVPLPLVSYGGSAMIVIMVGFGLVQSAHIHRARLPS